MIVNCINPQLYDTLSKQIGQEYNQEKGREVVDAVHNALTKALGVDDNEILPGASLVAGLNAESIDGLDISFRIKKSLRISDEEEFLKKLEKKVGETLESKTSYVERQINVLELTTKAYELYMER